jgi:hypothetical protein
MFPMKCPKPPCKNVFVRNVEYMVIFRDNMFSKLTAGILEGVKAYSFINSAVSSPNDIS